MWCLHNILLCFYCHILEYVHVNRMEYSTQLYCMSPSLVVNKMLADMLLCRPFYILECKMQCVPARHGGKCCTSTQGVTQTGSICYHMLSVNHPCSKLVSKITVWTVIFMVTFKSTVHLYNNTNFETLTEVLCILS